MQEQLTYSQFLEWVVFLNGQEIKNEFYLAQIAAEVCRSRVAEPGKVKSADFFFREPEDDDTRKPQWQQSKAIWAGSLGLKLPKEDA